MLTIFFSLDPEQMEHVAPAVGSDVTYDHLSFPWNDGKGDREVKGRYEIEGYGLSEASDIQFRNLQGIGLNKFSPGFYLISH